MRMRFVLIMLSIIFAAAVRCDAKISPAQDTARTSAAEISASGPDENAELTAITVRLDRLSAAIDELSRISGNRVDTLSGHDEDIRKLKALQASIREMIVDVDKRIARVDSVRIASRENSSGNFIIRGIKSGMSERKLTWLKDIRNFLDNEQSRLEGLTQGISTIRFVATTKAVQAKMKLAAALKGLF